MLVRDLGLIEYGDAWRLQLEAHDSVCAGDDERLLVCEHPTVITLGRVASTDDVHDKNIPVYEVERGGKATLHLPGQLVVYPIVDLKRRGKDLKGYLRALERSIILTLKEFGVEGKAVPGATGVWVGNRKIASLGVAVRKWITFHGLAFNVNCDLKTFGAINPCGFSPSVMTSLGEEIKERSEMTGAQLWEKAKSLLVRNLKTELVRQQFIEREEELIKFGTKPLLSKDPSPREPGPAKSEILESPKV
jgi:lipoyl(octanoyl) transferase